jgi:hypothetical protein
MMNPRLLVIIAATSSLLAAVDANAAAPAAHATQASSPHAMQASSPTANAVATGVIGAAVGKVIGPQGGALVANSVVGGAGGIGKLGHSIAKGLGHLGHYLHRHLF